ncbi:MAG: type II toxin-antitoxin system PemK/MazF family toxin [Dehalococcoidia bacterium]
MDGCRLRSPAQLQIAPPSGGLLHESTILCEQIRSISHDRFIRRLGMVPTATLEGVVWRLRRLTEP